MIRLKLIPVLMTLALLTSCGSKDEKGTPDVPATNTSAPAPSQLQPMPANGSANAPNAANTALNPAHGQPGHRCDISVGAPLNSAPAPAAAPANQAMPQNTVPAAAPTLNTTPANGVSASGLNPAHGQPGHRCDIAVGAPLNSKPSK
jgi:hypothetical protein